MAAVRTEQQRAWAAGERPSVEELLKRFPALAGDAEATIDLAYSEYILALKAVRKSIRKSFAGGFRKMLRPFVGNSRCTWLSSR